MKVPFIPLILATFGADDNGVPGEMQEMPPVDSALEASSLIYDFANLRQIVDEHEETFNEHLDGLKRRLADLVKFDSPQLIDTRNSASKTFPSTKMNNPITADAILEFLNKNEKFLEQDQGEDISFDESGKNDNPVYIKELLQDLHEEFDADIVEFDDEFADEGLGDSTLVYSIVVNRSHKRIDVVFRGSVTANDWKVDANFFKMSSDEFKAFTDRDVEIHSGFGGYLLEKTPSGNKSKFNQIIDVLKEIYAYKEDGRDYSDYSLYVTGHSLGGALAQLLSILLAGSPKADFIPKPIRAITFASPVVGDDEFRLAYQDLEKAGKLRHLRISNQNDVVPGAPAVGGYTQTGVNFHLRDGPMEAGYRNTKSIWSQTSFGSGSKHSLYGKGSYFQRMYLVKRGKLVNQEDLSLTMEQLYNKYAGDFTN